MTYADSCDCERPTLESFDEYHKPSNAQEFIEEVRESYQPRQRTEPPLPEIMPPNEIILRGYFKFKPPSELTI